MLDFAPCWISTPSVSVLDFLRAGFCSVLDFHQTCVQKKSSSRIFFLTFLENKNFSLHPIEKFLCINELLRYTSFNNYQEPFFVRLRRRFIAAKSSDAQGEPKMCSAYTRKFLFLNFVVASSVPLFAAEGDEKKPRKPRPPVSKCEANLSSAAHMFTLTSADEGPKPASNSNAIRAEKHSIYELVDSRPEFNLAVRHPSIVMTFPQVLMSWINIYPTEKRVEPEIGGRAVPFYPILGRATPENRGNFVVGHLDAQHVIVSAMMMAAATGQRSTKTPMLVGGAGTGKTVILENLASVGNTLSSTSLDHFLYTFRWIGLSKIPELKPLLPNSGSDEFDRPLYAEMHDSPIVLLPTDIQKAVIDLARDRAVAVSGYSPAPKHLEPQAKDARIYHALIDHYTAENGSVPLTSAQIIDILAKHVEIVRDVIDDNGKSGLIEPQGRDIDWAGLFFSSNAGVQADFGVDEAFGYFYTGKIPSGNRRPMLFDEYFRQPPPLRDMFLGVLESARVGRGGAQSVKLDTFPIAATNTESLEAALADGGSFAQADRFRLTPMLWHNHPLVETKTTLYVRGRDTFLQVPLVGSGKVDSSTALTAQAEAANLDELFVYPQNVGGQMIGPDGRYALKVKVAANREPVDIAPHSLMLMSMVAVATRLETDVAKAAKIGFNLGNAPIYHQPIMRLKAMLGEISTTAAERQQINTATKKLFEGSKGIGTRDVAKTWFGETLVAALDESNGNTITPLLVSKVFDELIGRTIKANSNQETLRWQQLKNQVIHELIVPRIVSDIMAAAGGSGVEDAYDEVFHELLALSTDDTVTEYESPRGGLRLINRERLEQIKKIYLDKEKRRLDPSQIINTHAAGHSTGVTGIRHLGLLNAIRVHYTRSVMDVAEIDGMVDYVRTGEGSNDTQQKVNGLFKNLRIMFGYNQQAAAHALEIMYEVNAKKK